MRATKQTVKNIRERKIESTLVARVKALGGICEKVKVIGKRGWPDRFCALPGGILILAETKRPRGGRLSVHQKRYLKKLTELGIVVAVINRLEDIDPLLSSASRK